MKTLIFSDVHGNLPALEKMLLTEKGCNSYICLGDVVNYGPWSNECVDLIGSLKNSVLLKGNHEEAFISGMYPGSNKIAKAFFDSNIIGFNRVDTVEDYQDSFRYQGFLCCHTIMNTYVYPDTSIKLDDNYIIGHSHHQFRYENNGFTLINAGSVGQNRKYIDVLDYIIFDSLNGKMELRSIKYNVDLLINELVARKYPRLCIDYYKSKSRI